LGKLVELYEEKRRIIAKLSEILEDKEKDNARRDSHSKRLPRPCGLTIHTGIGCDYACTYCYIYDMGFPGKVRPYPLKPLELAYAIALNPYVLPRKTLAAYGAVTEPFHPVTKDLAVSYIAEVYRWLALPSQVSTKSFIDPELAKKLKAGEPGLSVLITVVTLSMSRLLEPNAPEPLKRFEGAEIAVKHCLNVVLFMRPIIPGITDKEADKILELASEHGIKGVVLGSLRVTKGILTRLAAKGIDIQAIASRLPKMPTSLKDQITIRENELKKMIAKKAEDIGLKVYPAACAANIDAHNEFCNMCRWGPCGNAKARERIEYNDVKEYLDMRGIKAYEVEVDDDRIVIVAPKRVPRDALMHIMYASRLRVFVKMKN
jgi:DNA repair photolyase